LIGSTQNDNAIESLIIEEVIASAKLQSAPVRSAVFEFVLANFPAEGVAMDAQHLCGAALIALRALQGSFDEPFFKFSEGLIEEDSSFHHLADQPFQLIFHDCALHE